MPRRTAAEQDSETDAGDEDMDHAQRTYEVPSRPSEVTDELIPLLRGVSHAVAFLVAIAAAVVMIVIAPPGRATVAGRSTGPR